MAMFDGSFSSKIVENHTFICEHSIAQALGVCSTSRESFYEVFSKSREGMLTIAPVPQMGQGSTILNLFQVETGFYEYFDNETKIWVKKVITVSDVMGLLNFYELLQSGKIIANGPNQYRQQIDIRNIQSSIQKGIYFYKNLSQVSWLSGLVTNIDDECLIKLMFRPAKKANTKRKPTQKGPTMITSVPRDAAGEAYAFRSTDAAQSNSSSGAGTYLNMQPGGSDNVANTVCGELEMTYNKNSGRWQSGNRVALAKVIGTIQPAGVDKEPILLNSTNHEDFYTAGGAGNVANFIPGSAVILSIENNDPNMLGPNFRECRGGQKLQTIPIINRTNNLFEDGDLIKVTNVDNEWLAEPFAGETKPKAAKFGDWSFAKMIANTDTYFKDNNFYATGEPSSSFKNYETEARNRFYYNQIYSGLNPSFLSTLKANAKQSDGNNLIVPSFVPSYRYYVSTVYDQISKENGGFCDFTVIGRTNMALAEKGTFVYFDPDCPFFWGPVFSNGYSTLKFNPQYGQGSGVNENYLESFKYMASGAESSVPLAGEGVSANHLPAEMVGEILDFSNIIKDYERLGSTSRIPQNYYHKPTFYGSSPIGLNQLQFVPMTAEFAAHNDIWAQESYLSATANEARKFYTNVRSFFKDAYGFELTGHAFGNMFDRIGDRGKYTPVISVNRSTDGFIFLGNCSIIYNPSKTDVGNQNTVAYDCFIKQKPTSVPLGSPQYFYDSGDYLGANCVGITSAKNTFSKRGGGDLVISVNHVNIGLASNKQATPGSATELFINGFISMITNTGTTARNIERAMWGSTTDNIDSFGTTALHARIFDYWPREQTVFDPRYFGVLHFNAGVLGSTDGDVSTDFIELDYAANTVVYPNMIHPRVKNTVRRGQLLSGDPDGFKYKKRTLGLSNEWAVAEGGAGFQANEVIKIESTGAEILVVAINEDTSIKTIKVNKPGANYSLDSFSTPNPVSVLPVILNPSGGGGKNAVIWFYSLIVVETEEKDLPPKEHTAGPQRLTIASNGAGYINKAKETTISLTSNSTGKYDLFLHFHNDITHTSMLEHFGDQVVGFGQYLDVTFT